jgi:hypothetical protein
MESQKTLARNRAAVSDASGLLIQATVWMLHMLTAVMQSCPEVDSIIGHSLIFIHELWITNVHHRMRMNPLPK